MADDFHADAVPDPDELFDPPDGHVEQRPQWSFEEALLARSDRAPFDECMDLALAILAEEQYTRRAEARAEDRTADHHVGQFESPVGAQGTGSRVELDVVTLLGLAVYQAGVDQYALSDLAAKVAMEIYDIELQRVVRLLSDPDLAWALLDLEPGHPGLPAGRVREDWANYTHVLRQDGKTAAWNQLRQRAADAVTHRSGRYTRRLADLVSLMHRWNTAGWHASPEFPQLPTTTPADRNSENDDEPGA